MLPCRKSFIRLSDGCELNALLLVYALEFLFGHNANCETCKKLPSLDYKDCAYCFGVTPIARLKWR